MSRPTLMLIILCAVWGLTFPATKAAIATTTPLQFLALRFGIASLILIPVAAKRLGSIRSEWKPGDRQVWRWGIALGILLFTGYVLQAIGMRYTTASRSGFFTGLLTIIVPILAATFHTSRAPWMTWIGIPVAMCGVYLLADPSVGGLNRGDVLTIICAAVFALQMITLEAGERASRKATGKDPTTDLWLIQTFLTGIGCLVWALIEGAPLHVTGVGWLGIAYTALFGSVGATWAQTKYQPMVPAGHAALVFTLEPLFAALFASILLGDTWTGRGLIGAALILVAMTSSSFGLARKKAG